MEKLINICNCPTLGANIWFIIKNIRPAYWLDSYEITDKKQMEKIIEELKKHKHIAYKFYKPYEKKDNLFPEGPLIYNKKMLDKKDIELIEKSDSEIYYTKKFGEILGYGKCARDISKRKESNMTISFMLTKKSKLDTNFMEYIFLFGYGCNKKIYDHKHHLKLLEKMKKIMPNKKYSVELTISYL